MKNIYSTRAAIPHRDWLKVILTPARLWLVAIVLGSWFLGGNVLAQTAGDYRSNAAATMDWTATASWQRYNGTTWVSNPAEGYPGLNPGTGTVTILNEDAVTLNVSPANAIGALDVGVAVAGSGEDASLIFGAGSFTLTVTGKINVGGNNRNGLKQINVGTGTLNAMGDLQLGTGTTENGDNNNRRSHLLISTGTVNIAGGLIYTIIGGTNNGCVSIIFSDTGTVNLKGAFTFSNNTNGTLTPSTGTFNYEGNVAQTVHIGVAAITYNNLNINNTSPSGATISAAINATNVTGDISVGNINTGSLFNTNNLAITRGAGRTITVAAGSTMNAGTSLISFGTTGNMFINGTFRTANTNGFSGATNTSIVSTNTPTITLGTNSIIDYNAAGNQTVTSRTYASVQYSTSGEKTAAGALTVNSRAIFNGGTFKSGASTGFTSAMGAMRMLSSSAITLGTGTHNLNFSNSSGETWTGTLTINGWAGSYNGTTGTAGKIFFGTDATGLTPAQVSQIRFWNGSAFFPAIILSTGEVVPTGNFITTGTITGSPFCAGAAVSVPFTYQIPEGFPAGTTTFTAQLSDASGSFASPVSLGTVSSNASGSQSINGTIPAGASTGTGYRIRVVSSGSISVDGSPNTSDLTIYALPVVSITGPASICVGTTTQLSPSTGGTWISNNPGVASVTNAGLVTGLAPGGATFTFTETATSCSNTTGTVTVNTPPANPANPTSNSPQCANVGVSLTRSGTPPAGETWYWQTSASGTNTDNSGTTFTVFSSGTYYIRARNNTTLCWSTGAGSLAVTVNQLPTIVLGLSPEVCKGITSATLPYISTTFSPNQYSINYDATALGQGFVNVTNATLNPGSITLAVPAGAVAGTYNGTLTVRNSTTGCVSSSGVPFTVKVQQVLVSHNITQPTCFSGGSITLTVSGGTEPYSYDWSDLDRDEQSQKPLRTGNHLQYHLFRYRDRCKWLYLHRIKHSATCTRRLRWNQRLQQ
jgi:hypothetical protein